MPEEIKPSQEEIEKIDTESASSTEEAEVQTA